MRKNVVHYLVAFILPVFIFCVAMAAMNMYPFGDVSFRISDALGQYPGFFESLKDIHWFSLEIGLGANYYPIFTTYLMNPLNFLYLFFHNYQFDLFYVIFILFKIGLIGLTMNTFLNYKRKINKKSWIFSTIYALSGFVSAYYWNYQFLDAIYMMPLIMIGLRKLVEENKSLMYYLTLTIMIIIHYYTGYMCCIFALIYFWFLMYNGNYDNKKQKVKNFIVTSLLSGLSSAFVLIPTMYSFMQGRQSYFDVSSFFGVNFVLLNNSVYNFSIGSYYLVDLANNSPSTYITIFAVVLLIMGFFRDNLGKRYKKSIIIILLLYFLSCFVNIFYLFWHMFQAPVGIPGRFIFGFNIYLVLFAYDNFLNIDNVKLKNKMYIILFLIVIMIGTFILKNYFYNIDVFNNDYVYYILLFFSLLFYIYYFIGLKNNAWKYLTVFLIFLEVFINLIMAFNVNFQYVNYDYLDVKKFNEDNKNMNSMLSTIRGNNRIIKVDGAPFFNSFFHANGISRYTSIYNNNLNTFLNNYNYNRNSLIDHSFRYKHDLFMDALLSTKYIFYNYNNIEHILKNKYVVESLGFLVSNNQTLKYENDAKKIFAIISNLDVEVAKLNIYLDNVKEGDDVYELIDPLLDGKVVREYSANKDIFVNIDSAKVFNFYSNEDLKNRYSGKDFIKLFVNDVEVGEINELNKGDVLRVEIEISKEMKGIVKIFDSFEYVEKDLFIKAIDELNKNKIENIKVNSLGFTGNFKATNEKNLLLLTIPYDRGIEIKIDGVKTNYEKYLNGAIGVKVDEGSHEIEFIYHVIGLRLGLVISLMSMVIYFIKCYWKRLKK